MATETHTPPDLTSSQRATVAGVERALATFGRETARLLTPDGRRLYADDEHARREAELRATRDAAIAAAEAAATDALRSAEADRERLEHRDLLDTLTPAELDRATVRREFVREDCERLPIEELAARLRAALDTGDRPMLFLLVRYGTQRAEAEAERGHSVRSHAGLIALHDALREAGARFTDADAQRRATARHEQARAFHRAVAETVRPVRVAEMVGQMRASGRYGILATEGGIMPTTTPPASPTPIPRPRLPYQVPVRQAPNVPLRVPLRDPDASPPQRPSTPKER